MRPQFLREPSILTLALAVALILLCLRAAPAIAAQATAIQPAAATASLSAPASASAFSTAERIREEIDAARKTTAPSLPVLIPVSEARAVKTTPAPLPKQPEPAATPTPPPDKQPAATTPPPKPATDAQPSGPGASVKTTEQTKDEAKKLKLEINGFRYLKYRQYSSSGNSSSFLSRSGLMTYGDKFEQGSNLRFTATQGKTKFKGDIQEMPMQERNMVFDLESGQYLATMGDFTSKFKGGTLATLNKRITGAEIGYKTKKLDIMTVFSQSKSETRTISFNGNNTHGPYDLKTFEILPDSASVKLNGQTLDPNDYDLDFYAGQITFCSSGTPPKCTNIKTSDTVQVIFEQKLLLSLKGGNIQGLAADYKLANGSFGAAFLTQQANRASQRIRRTKEQTITGAQLISQGALDSDQRTILLDATSTRYSGLVFMAKYTETVTRNGTLLQRNTDYSIPYAGNGLGQIILAATPSATDTYVVSFSYYVDEFVNLSIDEDIFDTGQSTNIYYLSKYKVYPGLETLKYCRTDRCEVFDILEQGANKDYTIDEENNAILIHSAKRPNTADQTFIRISYFYVPTGSPDSSPYDHTVQNLFGSYNFGELLSLDFEYATSNSDISRTSVQVMNEVLLTATATFTCPASASPAPDCVRTLTHDNIEESSEILRLNNKAVALTRGADYQFDPTTGRVTFTNGFSIPQGAVVYASYRFLPAADIGLSNGGAYRLAGRSTFKGIALEFKKESTDTKFAPIGGNNTLETDRFEYKISAPLGKTLNLTTARSRFVTAQDIYEIFSTTNTENTTSLSYAAVSKGGKKSFLKGAVWTFGDTKAADNRMPRYDDTTRKNNSIDLEFDLPFAKNATLEYSAENEDFTDNSQRTDNTTSSKNSWVMSYKPREELSVDITLGTEKVSSFGVSEPYGTRTSSRNIQLLYQPVALVTIAASIDSQRVSDPRDTSGGGADTSNVRITTKPFWKVRVFSHSITQQDRPSQFTGGTQSDVSNTTFTIAGSKDVSFTPTFTVSKSSSPGTSSKTNMTSLKVEYLPPKRKLESVLTRDLTKTSSNSDSSGGSSSNSRRLAWDFRYKLSPTVNLIYKFSTSTSSSSGYAASTGENKNIFQVVRKVGEKLDLRLQYSVNKNTGSSPAKEKAFDIISEYKLKKYLSWNLDYNMSKYSSSEPSGGYSGTLLETELKLEF